MTHQISFFILILSTLSLSGTEDCGFILMETVYVCFITMYTHNRNSSLRKSKTRNWDIQLSMYNVTPRYVSVKFYTSI